MNCPKCHGKGWVYNARGRWERKIIPCGCHAGQVSCCEGGEQGRGGGMLNHLIRITLRELMSDAPLPKAPCWVDQVIWDIPKTVMGYIESAPPNVKALTFRPWSNKFDAPILAACERKGITVVWASPPEYVRWVSCSEGEKRDEAAVVA